MKNKFYLFFSCLKDYLCKIWTHIGEKNNAIFYERYKRRNNVANDALMRKAKEQTVEEMN